MAESAFRRVAGELRAAIEAGTYPPGAALPTVQEIADRFEVSKQTAHNAIKALANEGLVRVQYRRGSYVRELPRERAIIRDRCVYRDELGYFFDRNAADWSAVGTPTRGLGVPPNHVADLLGIPQGEDVVVRDRQMGPAGAVRPLQLATSYIPVAVASDIPALRAEQTGPGGIYDRIEEHFDASIDWRETISARLPSDAEQDLLGVPPTVPVLVVTRESRVYRKGEWLVVEVNETRMPAEQFAVSYSVQRDASAVWPREEAA
ncbi:GntR family transcriptional regulator [Streptomyces sp. NPDC058657]|uniref:GntR family transcriptional regulator n=1 Tax=unclassified Streptomyces TaxID=2593676 RepID=UPI003659350C